MIFDAFPRGKDGVAAASHHRLNAVRLRPERGRHFGRFQDAQSTARAGADEHDSSTLAQRAGDHLHADGDAFALAADGLQHLAIFIEHQVDDIVSGELVDAETERIDGFSGQRLPL